MVEPVDEALTERARRQLRRVAEAGVPITYQALAEKLALQPPNRIHQVAMALEQLMHEDAADDRPFIAALVVSKRRNGLPAPGFFDLARRLGRFQGDRSEAAMENYHRAELDAAVPYWRAAGGGGGVRFVEDNGREHIVHAYTDEYYGLEDIHGVFGLGRIESGEDNGVSLILTSNEIRNLKAMADAQSFDHPEGFIALCLDIHDFVADRGPGPFAFRGDG